MILYALFFSFIAEAAELTDSLTLLEQLNENQQWREQGCAGLEEPWLRELQVQAQALCKAEGNEQILAKFSPPASGVLGTRPFSKRALAFARHYQQMSEATHAALGEPRVITSLAFEPHVVKDVAEHLEKLERAIHAAKKLREAGQGNVAAAGVFAAEMAVLFRDPDMRTAMARFGLRPFVQNAPWNWGWRHLDKIISDLESVYENMAAMNMHIFSYMSSPQVSPLVVYFKKAAECDPSFSGRVEFPDDPQGLLQEAFVRFHRLRHTRDLAERKKLSWEFSTLLIAHEQIYAQTYYDRIQSQHEKLKGLFKVIDPLGTYRLDNRSWADFRVRFSLPLDRELELEKITAADILGVKLRAGTIPDYYRSRIMHADAAKLLAAPIFPEESVSKNTTDTSLDKDGQAMALLQEHGCLGCHAFKDASAREMVGPDLSHLGKLMSKDQIREAIVNPNASISKNCDGGKLCPENIMPQEYASTLKREELDLLVDFFSRQR